MNVVMPDVLAIDIAVRNNSVQQIGQLRTVVQGTLAGFTRQNLEGKLFRSESGDETLILFAKPRRLPEGHERILIADSTAPEGDWDLGGAQWLKHPLMLAVPQPDIEIEKAIASWDGAFTFVRENQSRGIIGLRTPQIGALHAIHAHWTVSSATGTIVMPTGTGKTDTMLATLISQSVRKLLVVVPTDALRTQLAEKFLKLGVLKLPEARLLAASARHPVVCTLLHKPRDEQETDEIFSRAQVIVTTSAIAGRCKEAVQKRMAHHCEYLFIDEAHHVEAPTWSRFKAQFGARRTLQFTATPFREDGKLLDGKIIYDYPLRKAQEEGYFKPIRFTRVSQFNRKRADRAIAAAAVKQLRKDARKGHILMARVDSVERAKEVFKLYERLTKFNPVQLHSGITSAAEREEIRRKILDGTSRIVVCVDMLGEGFDLPELKIAAFHDIRKSLAVTLQLAGRFTRFRPDLGEATFIANIADVSVREELRKLYSRDPDWNALLPELSERETQKQISLQDFLAGFTAVADEIPLKSLEPATSAVVYRTICNEWAPDSFKEGIPGIEKCERVQHSVNEAKHTLVVVTAQRSLPSWTDVEEFSEWQWDLYIATWFPDQNLLFIHGSSNSGEYKTLAKAVAGEEVALIKGNEVFRTFGGINRLRLQNVGLTEQLGRRVRYTGRMGSDVGPAVSDDRLGHARKSVLSGTGFEHGRSVSVGASGKGRIWSHRRDHIDEFVQWCHSIGVKLLDETIDPDAILRGTLEAEAVSSRPDKMPIGVDWPIEIYNTSESGWWIDLEDEEFSVGEVSLELVAPATSGPLRIALASESRRVVLELELFATAEGSNYRFAVVEGGARVSRGGRSARQDAPDFFDENPPVIWFHDGASLEGNQLTRLKSRYGAYDRQRVEAWDWTGSNIRVESQGRTKKAHSIQARVIRELRNKGCTVIFDDDGKGEAADVIAAWVHGPANAPTHIDVALYHCKFSGAAQPGARLDDLYEVCGQVQKSSHWSSSPAKATDLFTHMLRREERRSGAGRTRFELGDSDLLLSIREMSHLCDVTFKIFMVQPGLSRASATQEQLELLSVAESHLLEMYEVPLVIIASA
jgi:superfamily II DNA or RNA helicase